jgi:fluoride ion exporter CrcB/FEX
MIYLLLILGGGFGIALCLSMQTTLLRRLGITFPRRIIVESTGGSLLVGVLAGYFAMNESVPRDIRLPLVVGTIVGYLTSSAFVFDGELSWERNQFGMSALYLAVWIAASSSSLVVGLALANCFI